MSLGSVAWHSSLLTVWHNTEKFWPNPSDVLQIQGLWCTCWLHHLLIHLKGWSKIVHTCHLFIPTDELFMHRRSVGLSKCIKVSGSGQIRNIKNHSIYLLYLAHILRFCEALDHNQKQLSLLVGLCASRKSLPGVVQYVSFVKTISHSPFSLYANKIGMVKLIHKHKYLNKSKNTWH